ncbi:NADP-dependent isocitrate dehydrogenase, partial [Bacillus sp. S34]|nr:NADP-dependent isocitrate dehydrogenase [Bacillus sp. S34]
AEVGDASMPAMIRTSGHMWGPDGDEHDTLAVIPDSMGPYLAGITGLLSMPLTFFMSNDAFYFGILPVLSESAASFGITPAEMARASVVGQPVHMQ